MIHRYKCICQAHRPGHSSTCCAVIVGFSASPYQELSSSDVYLRASDCARCASPATANNGVYKVYNHIRKIVALLNAAFTFG